MDSDDARYERPCRWLLAVAAGIHWVATAAALPLSPQLDVQPAVQLATTIERLLSVLLQA